MEALGSYQVAQKLYKGFHSVIDEEYAVHGELVEVIKNGTPAKFRKSMRRHLNNHFQRVV